MPMHNVRLSGTKTGIAAMEMLEDRLAEVLDHYQNPLVSGKASKVKIELVITPDENRERFDITVAGGTALSPRKTFASSLFAGINSDGEMEAVEHNPRQLRIPYEQPLSTTPE